MNHLLLLLFALVISSLSSTGQALKPCYEKDEKTKAIKWGFCDCFYSDVVIKCDYDTVFAFSDGMAAIGLKGKYGYVDKTGKLAITPKFDGADIFSEGFAAVMVAGNVYYVDKKGTDIFKKTFKMAGSFSDGRALVANQEGKLGFLDTKGNMIVPFSYKKAYPFKGGLAPVFEEETKTWKAINTKGETVFTFPDKVKNVFGSFSEGLARVYVDGPSGYNVHYDFVDSKGEFICDAPYSEVKPFWSGRAIVANENTNRSGNNMQFLSYGLIKNGGRQIVSSKYACLEESPIPGIYYYGTQSSSISNCSGYGLLDSNGREITQPKYAAFTRLNDTTFLCKEAGKYQSLNRYLLLTTRGKELLGIGYKEKYFQIAGPDTLLVLLTPMSDNSYAQSVYNIRTGLLKENAFNGLRIYKKSRTLLIMDWQYASGALMTTDGKIIMDKVQTHTLDPKGTDFDKMPFVLIRKFEEKDFKLYNLNTKKYISGNFGFKTEEKDIYNKHFSDGLLAINQKGKWGYIDTAGRIKIAAVYESAEDFHEGWAAVEKKEKGEFGDSYMVYVDKTGREMPGIKADYLNAGDFNDGIAKYETVYQTGKEQKVIYINKSGKAIFQSEGKDYYKHGDFSNGLAAVSNKEGKIGYINTKGELVIPYQFKIPRQREFASIMSFSKEGYALVEKDGKELIIDKTGNEAK